MRILLVKTSSLGDVIHNLPAVSDLLRGDPRAAVDWCVEESFAAIPRLHPGVRNVIPVALRRWRKTPLNGAVWREIRQLRAALRAADYDFVIDTQGLFKSAVLARQARGVRCGYAAASAREPLAALFYQRTFVVAKGQHAVARNRQLVAAAGGLPAGLPLDYGLCPAAPDFPWLQHTDYAVLLTATSRDDKLWDEGHWIELAGKLRQCGLKALFPGGSGLERERAERLAKAVPGAIAVPPLAIDALARLLAGARLAVGVDTGLTHLAAALAVPTVAIYTATDPGLTGVLGCGFYRNLGGVGAVPTPVRVLDECLAGLR